MSKELSYTIEEVAQLLKVSKLTIYDLVKKGELPVFRVGRQMRMDAKDLDKYIKNHKTTTSQVPIAELHRPQTKNSPNLVISGQDIVLDILGKYIEKYSTYKTLRSYTGSLNSLISMYNGECDIVSLHLFDGDTGEYNLPYIKKILVGHSYLLLNLLSRKAGFYVQKGNPLNIQTWTDLNQEHVKMINREKGSGARILLDEQLRMNHLQPKNIRGYEQEETSHLSVASSVSTGGADVGVGIEKAAKIVGIDFIPLITERYDLIILKTPENEKLISTVKEILSSHPFQSEINSLGDYDYSQTGSIIYET
ncbi:MULTISPECIES: helix-turn-helix transcriptional regulator [Metabacillus]|jgi:putative molybdopterin biosynthesis protein|uniref:Helix-turn-helix transcriptional regulator n=1 Tax=Metabacillus rhizolycopersici TaxID=2875709 RepID=A0ABS7UXM4_9BACI|nr:MULTISPECIES: helix-turn-helix transcriptional regulator [Metabacillus]MBZ5752974.1 helix-turn-helix transcriptional regulator [Metabacillus rhizolycopersici]MCM3652500.1 helix-turn-helix transcriptional regulator [Metabacillus litoralis]